MCLYPTHVCVYLNPEHVCVYTLNTYMSIPYTRVCNALHTYVSIPLLHAPTLNVCVYTLHTYVSTLYTLYVSTLKPYTYTRVARESKAGENFLVCS